MDAETVYLVSTNSKKAADKIISLWGGQSSLWGFCEKEGESSFTGLDVDIFDVMARVIRSVHKMESSGQKDHFNLSGRFSDGYDYIAFMIEYSGNEPTISASAIDEDDEEIDEDFFDADFDRYELISDLLVGEKYRTFRQAIEDNIPLGGHLDCTYEEWYNSVIAE